MLIRDDSLLTGTTRKRKKKMILCLEPASRPLQNFQKIKINKGMLVISSKGSSVPRYLPDLVQQ